MLHGKKRYLIPAALLLLVVAYFVVNHVTSSAFVTPRFEKNLSRKWLAEVELHDVDFRLVRGTRIDTLTILPQSSSNDEPPVTLKGLHIYHRLGKLLTGTYEISSITVEQVEAGLSESDVTWLNRVREKMRKKAEPMDVADTTVKDGTLTVPIGKNNAPVSLTEVHLETHQKRPGDKVTGEGHFTLGTECVQFNFLSYPERKRTRATVSFRDFGLGSVPLKTLLGRDSTVQNLGLSGTAEGRISLRRAGNTGQGAHVSGAVSFSDASVAHKLWQAKARNISGRIEFTGKAFDVQRLSGDLAGGHFSLSGLNLRFSEGKCNSVSVSGRASGLDPTRLPLEALPGNVAEEVKKAELQSGKVDVEANAEWRQGEGADWKTDLKARELAFTVPPLRTKASNVSFDATVSSEGDAIIHRADAQIYDGRVELRGSLGWSKGDVKPQELELEFTNIPPADRLIQHMPHPVPKIDAALGPEEARCNGTVQYGDDGTQLDLRVETAQLHPSELSHPLREASFNVQWDSSGHRVWIPRLQTRHGSGLLHGRASIAYGDETRLTLMLEGYNLAIDNSLLSLAPQPVRKNLSEWKPAGKFDFRLRLLDRKLGGVTRKNMFHDVAGNVTFRNVSVQHPELGTVADGVEGHIGLGSEGVNVHRMTGELFGLSMSLDGDLQVTEQMGADLRFRSERTHVTSRLAERCPEPFGSLVEKLDLGGEFEARGTVSFPADGTKGLKASMDIPFYGLELGGNDASVRGTGHLYVEFPALTGSDKDFTVNISFDSLQVSNLEVETGSASLARRGQKLHLTDGHFALYNGALDVPEATIQLKDRSWNATVQLSYLELESLLVGLGISGQRIPSGILTGDTSLEGRGMSMNRLSADGEIHVSRGRLYDIPLMLSVFNFLDLKIPHEGSITRAYGSFRIEDQKLRIEDLLLAGSATPVHVTGKMSLNPDTSLKKQNLNLLLSIVSPQGILDSIPVVDWVKRLTLDQIRKYVLQARVEGTVDEYDISGVATQVSAPITALWSLLQKVSPPEPEAVPKE